MPRERRTSASTDVMDVTKQDRPGAQREGKSIPSDADVSAPTTPTLRRSRNDHRSILAIQRIHGNQATTRFLQRVVPSKQPETDNTDTVGSEQDTNAQRETPAQTPPTQTPSSTNGLHGINWSTATAVKRLGDHPVFKIDLPSGPVVVKVQSAGTSAKEVFSGDLAGSMLEGSDKANMRILSPGERAAFYDAMRDVAGDTKKLFALKGTADTGLMVMDFMSGADLGEAGHLFKPTDNDSVTENGMERVKNIGELLAFHFFIQGSDRFAIPTYMQQQKFTGMSRNDNIRLSTTTGSNRVQALDNTIRPAIKYDLEEGAVEAAQQYQHFLAPLVHELILNPNGDDLLTTTLAEQLQVGDIGAEGRANARTGFLAGLKNIGSSQIDMAALLKAVGSQEVIGASEILAQEDPTGSTYVHYLSEMRAFFKQTFALHEAVTAAAEKPEHKDTIAILQLATRTRVNRDREPKDTVFLQQYDRNPLAAYKGTKGKKKRKSHWEAGLARLEKDKNSLGKPVTPERGSAILDNIVSVGHAMLAEDDPAIVEDFRRMAAKVLLRMKYV